jgi:hypothetical protein
MLYVYLRVKSLADLNERSVIAVGNYDVQYLKPNIHICHKQFNSVIINLVFYRVNKIINHSDKANFFGKRKFKIFHILYLRVKCQSDLNKRSLFLSF